MRVASIDVGTNSVLLLIAEVDLNGTITPLWDEAQITRLGEGFGGSKVLTPEAMERTFAVLKKYMGIAQSYRVTEVRAAGTSALRDAENRETFLGQVQHELGLSIDVISGEREAWLTYKASVLAFPELTGKTLMLDIGGGST
ncbi:MAG: exopolyphosphatase, partial [Nitrospira sp.]|nr:exopolyphosphatase [Nitrospira sp.]